MARDEASVGVMEKQAARGVLWTLVELGGGEGLTFLAFVVLVRLIAPEDFGVMAVAGVVVQFAQMFVYNGFSDAIIQREYLDETHRSTAFWANLAISGAMLVVIQATADLWSMVFGLPLLGEVLRWMSVLFVTMAMTSIHQALFRRDLNFMAFALRSVGGIVTGGVVAVAMALTGFGVWSLVGQQLANAMASIAIIWATSGWRPRFTFSWRAFREMVRFAMHVFGGNLVDFGTKKVDVLVIGLFLDARSLGLYYIVQRILITICLFSLSSFRSVVMPVLSRIGPTKFNGAYTDVVRISYLAWAPMALGIGMVGPYVLPAVFGPKWNDAIAPLVVMSLTGYSQAMTAFTGQALTAFGRPEEFTRMSVAQLVGVVIAFMSAARFGIMGVAWAYTAVSVLSVPLHLGWMSRVTGLSPLSVARSCLVPAVATTLMCLALYIMPYNGHPLWWAALMVGVGGLTYVGAVAVMAPWQIRNMMGLLGMATSGA